MVISQFPARFGKYILLDRLNAGGMAEVFRAKVQGAEKFERLVAIKCMLPQLLQDEHFISMFIDEAKLAAQLNHANIVQIYELGRLGERLYIAMELVQGRDLRHILRTARANMAPIPVGFAAYVVSKSAEGLDFAHRKSGVDGQPLNLVHRDVSPQNILVSYDGEVKVVDFGIAKAEARATETQAGVLKGKFAYMAPEQVIGSPIDRRADIFALGSVLYEVITGQRLFTGDNDLSVLEKVRAAKLPDLRALLPEGGEELEHVLLRALAKKPEDRYTFASEMAEDLEHLLIEDRSIFGYKRAAQFMQTLYADEVTHLGEQLRRYAEVTSESCVVTIGEEAPTDDSRPFVFDANLEGSRTGIPTRTVGNTVQTHSAHPDEPSQVRRRARPQSQTGGYTRPLQSRRMLSGQGGATAVEPNPTTTRTSRVLRNLRVALMLSAFVTAVLVIAVSLKVPLPHSGAAALENFRKALPGRNELSNIFQQVDPGRTSQQPPPSPSPPPSPPPPPPQQQPIADEDNRDEEDNRRAGFGWLVIRTMIDRGRVYIDGKDAGPLPLPAKKLKVGFHDIRIVDDAGNVRNRISQVLVTTRNTRKAPKLVSTQ